MSTKNETRITLRIGKAVIPAVLNETLTAREFCKCLPFTVTASKGEFDFCGIAGSLACQETERQNGWKNGDIGYSRGWFALFHSGEDQSSGYTGEMIIGHIDEEYLETVRRLNGSVNITIELAQ